MTTGNPTPQPAASGLASQLLDEWQRRQPELTAHKHEAVKGLVNEWLEAHEQDLASLVRPHVLRMLESDQVPDHVRELLNVLAAPEHQTQFFTALFAIQGIINAFVQAAVAPYVNDVSQAAWSHDPSLMLSPDQAADLVLKGWWSQADGEHEAALSGIGTNRFTRMVQLAGEPPGVMGLLDLWRRGLLSDADLERGVKESRVRDEWLDTVKLMATVAPSVAEVLSGYVQGHLSEADAREKFKHAGGRDEDFSWLFQTTGRPPGAQEMLHLWNRGVVTEADVDAAIRESDIKDKYLPAVKALRVYLPPPRSIVAMIRQGAISDAEARTFLTDAGVAPDVQETFIKSGHHTAASAVKQISAAKVVTGYEEGTLSRSQAEAQLATTGWNATQAGMLLDIADAALVHKEQQHVISSARTLYTRHRVSRSDTSIALDATGITPTQRDSLLRLWDIERVENAHVLTKSEVLGAYRRGKRDKAWTNEHLLALGYAEADLDAIRAEAWPPPHGSAPADA